MKICKRNPQLPPHKHHRENGSLVCEGYNPEFAEIKRNFELAVKKFLGYIPE